MGCRRVVKIILVVLLAILLSLCLLFIYPCGYFLLKSDPNYKPHALQNNAKYSGIGGYLINLDRSKDRYNYVKSYIDGLKIPMQRISAVDGSLLNQDDLKNMVDFSMYNNLVSDNIQLGTVGCSLSHIKIWKTFLNSNYEFALIFEDDVSFDPEKLQLVIQELVENKQMWDITTFQIHHRGFPLTIKELSNGYKMSLYLFNVSHSGAYIINRKAAEKLLEKALPIKMPIDWYFTRSWELDLKFIGIENPRLVSQTFGTSEIKRTTQIHGNYDGVINSIRKKMYASQTAFIRYLYNLNLYINMQNPALSNEFNNQQ